MPLSYNNAYAPPYGSPTGFFCSFTALISLGMPIATPMAMPVQVLSNIRFIARMGILPMPLLMEQIQCQ